MPLHTLTLGESGSIDGLGLRFGDPVVFLHGLFGQGRNWNTIGKALAPTHRVTLVDLPHHGRSPHPDHFDYLEVTAAVAETLTEPAAVVGHSMGGKVAMLLAITRPDLVSRLVVADMSPVVYERASDFNVYVDALRSLDLSALTRRDEADAALADAVPDATIRGFLLQNLRRDGGADGSGWRWAMNLDVLGRDMARIGDWPAARLAGLAPYEGPVLWLGGERSDYVTDEYAPAMREWFPRYRRVTIKNAGHWIHSEQPETFLTVLRTFLEG